MHEGSIQNTTTLNPKPTRNFRGTPIRDHPAPAGNSPVRAGWGGAAFAQRPGSTQGSSILQTRSVLEIPTVHVVLENPGFRAFGSSNFAAHSPVFCWLWCSFGACCGEGLGRGLAVNMRTFGRHGELLGPEPSFPKPTRQRYVNANQDVFGCAQAGLTHRTCPVEGFRVVWRQNGPAICCGSAGGEQ